MIVRSFLKWYEAALAHERGEAVQLLAHSYLAGELGSDTPQEAEAALTLALDDAALSVRRALAWSLALSDRAPRHIIVSLAHDHPEVSALILARSPLLRDADLIDCIRTGDRLTSLAIALREGLSGSVIRAMVEHACEEGVMALVENGRAELQDGDFEVIIRRFEDKGEMREALIRRPDLPASIRQRLVSVVADRLCGFMTLTGWVDEGRARRLAGDARETATIELAETSRDLDSYVEHLRACGHLTPSLLLRSLLCGETALLGASLVRLAGLNPRRVASMMSARNPGPFIAAYHKACLPKVTLPAFVGALEGIRDLPADRDCAAPRLQRRVIERALAACLLEDEAEMRPVLAMLRRYDAEAARAEARLMTERLKAADEAVVLEARTDAPPPLVIEEAMPEVMEEGYIQPANEEAPVAAPLPAVAACATESDALAEFEAEFGPLETSSVPEPASLLQQRISRIADRPPMPQDNILPQAEWVDAPPVAEVWPEPAVATRAESRLSDELEALFAKAFAQDAAADLVLSNSPYNDWELRKTAA